MRGMGKGSWGGRASAQLSGARDQEKHFHFLSKQVAFCKGKLESTLQANN